MTPPETASLFLLAVAGILLAGNFGEILSRRTGIPDALWLIGAGVLLGPGLHLVPREAVQGLAPFFGALALIVVLLEGGSRLRLPELVRTPRAAALAVLAFAGSVLAVAAASMLALTLHALPDGWGWPQALLLGAILGGTSAAILVPALTHARIEPRVAGLLSLESALADALAVLAVVALVDAAGLAGFGRPAFAAGLAAAGTSDPGRALAARLAIGLGLGVLAGLLGLLFLRALRGVSHAYPITLSILLVLYVGIGRAGGEPVAGILAVAVVLGHAPAISRALKFESGVELGEDVRGFHSQLAFVIKAFFFTFIGVSLGPPWELAGVGFALAVVVLAVRWPAVVAATRGSEFTVAQKHVFWIGAPRGMSTGVLALLPAAAGIPFAAETQAVAFAAIAAIIPLFTVGLRLVRSAPAPAPYVRTWTPTAVSVPAAPTVTEAPADDPFATLADILTPARPATPPPATGSAPASPYARDAEIKPGSGFRW